MAITSKLVGRIASFVTVHEILGYLVECRFHCGTQVFGVTRSYGRQGPNKPLLVHDSILEPPTIPTLHDISIFVAIINILILVTVTIIVIITIITCDLSWTVGAVTFLNFAVTVSLVIRRSGAVQALQKYV